MTGNTVSPSFTDSATIRRLWNLVFNLSLNFLHSESDAEDAAQEIFLKAQGAIASFRGESSLDTWVYRIAFNYLVDRKRLGFREEISFELFAEDVSNAVFSREEAGLSADEERIYAEEIKIGCTRAMLQCLDPPDRLVYILGKLFGLSGKDGAAISGLSEAAYRQRLSRSSRRITAFMEGNCGLLCADAVCRCGRRIGVALERGRISPEMLLYRTESRRIRDYLNAMNELDSVAEIFRDNLFLEKVNYFTESVENAVRALADAT